MTANAKKCFRPTLETLENREMMDAGIGGAVMHPMMPVIAQGAQVRFLAQEPSALQNPNNPLSQALTQANQAFVAQSQQLNANVQAAVDHIFSAWSHHVDQVVQNIPGLQAVANYQLHKDNPTATLVHNIPGLQDVAGRIPASTFGELSQGDQQYQLEHGPTVSDWNPAKEMGTQFFDRFKNTFAQARNVWGIEGAWFRSATSPSSGRYEVNIELTRRPWVGDTFKSTLTVKFGVFHSGGWSERDHSNRYYVSVTGSDVTTHGKPDASLFLLQAALSGFQYDI
jgi:hypothetical protein